MHIKHTSILAALLLVSSVNVFALQLRGGTTPSVPSNSYPNARDDHISAVAGVYIVAEGNVISNDINGTIATLEQSWVGQYGLITSFDSDGEYTYQLFDSTTNASRPSSGVGIDSFTYTLANESGQTDTARLIIDVNADPNLSDGSSAPIARNDTNTISVPIERRSA